MGDLIEDRIIDEHERKKNEAYWKERNVMTCRLEEEFYARPHPKSCPKCGLAGKCSKGYTQIKNEAKPGYAIQAPSGQVNFYGPLGQPEGSQGPIGTTGYTVPPPAPQPIPEGVYYNAEHDNFYSIATNKGMGNDFWREWCARRKEFPNKAVPIPERMGYTNDPKPVPNTRPMSLHKRLMLMVFLQQTFKITSEAELFELAKEIERLTRD